MTTLSESAFRSALLDSNVRKRRPLRAYGVYVNAEELHRALRERGVDATGSGLDAVVTRLGGHRLEHGILNRLLAAVRVGERPVEYFLPELTYRRVRQSRRR